MYFARNTLFKQTDTDCATLIISLTLLNVFVLLLSPNIFLFAPQKISTWTFCVRMQIISPLAHESAERKVFLHESTHIIPLSVGAHYSRH